MKKLFFTLCMIGCIILFNNETATALNSSSDNIKITISAPDVAYGLTILFYNEDGYLNADRFITSDGKCLDVWFDDNIISCGQNVEVYMPKGKYRISAYRTDGSYVVLFSGGANIQGYVVDKDYVNFDVTFSGDTRIDVNEYNPY